MRRVALASAILVLVAASLAAQSDSEDLKGTVDGTIEVEKGTQKLQDEWAQEQAELLARYRSAKANVKYLKERIDIEQSKSDALDETIADLERRLAESDRLNSVLLDTLQSVYSRLDTWVHDDLPFLMTERENRLQSLRDELARPDVAGAEKLRRVLEALQIEAQYGATVEVSQEHIMIGDEEILADVLRLGRVSAFWRTPDRKRVGEFDRATRTWIELDSKYGRSIGQAMEMASRMRPIEIIDLPLGRIAP